MEDGRICTKCGEYKTRDYFYKAVTGYNGYKSECMACTRARVLNKHREDMAGRSRKRLEPYLPKVKIKPDNCPEITLEMLEQLCPKEKSLSLTLEECSER